MKTNDKLQQAIERFQNGVEDYDDRCALLSAAKELQQLKADCRVMVEALNAVDIRNTNPMTLYERDMVYDARMTPTAKQIIAEMEREKKV